MELAVLAHAVQRLTHQVARECVEHLLGVVSRFHAASQGGCFDRRELGVKWEKVAHGEAKLPSRRIKPKG